MPEQVCITKDNTQLGGRRHPLLPGDRPAPRLLRLVELRRGDQPARADHAAQRDRQDGARQDASSRATRSTARSSPSLDEAGRNWGIKVLRYEIKSLTPPESILRAMQAQITAEREKRALIAKSEGERQQEINVADGEQPGRDPATPRARSRRRSTGRRARRPRSASSPRRTRPGARGGRGDRRQGRHGRGQPQGGAAVRRGLRQPREDQSNTLIIPANAGDVAGLVATAMTRARPRTPGETRQSVVQKRPTASGARLNGAPG